MISFANLIGADRGTSGSILANLESLSQGYCGGVKGRGSESFQVSAGSCTAISVVSRKVKNLARSRHMTSYPTLTLILSPSLPRGKVGHLASVDTLGSRMALGVIGGF